MHPNVVVFNSPISPLTFDDALIDRLGLEEHADEQVHSLPLGWKQKIAFSAAILHEPKIVFLDEPTGGVDPISRREFWGVIDELASGGTTISLVSLCTLPSAIVTASTKKLGMSFFTTAISSTVAGRSRRCCAPPAGRFTTWA